MYASLKTENCFKSKQRESPALFSFKNKFTEGCTKKSFENKFRKGCAKRITGEEKLKKQQGQEQD